jgi:Transposase DDE domain
VKLQSRKGSVKATEQVKGDRKITHWRSYNQSLVKWGSLTLWIDETVADNWLCCTHHGGRGRGFKFSELAIETSLMLKVMFTLPLRALEGLINSLFRLTGIWPASPDYSSISRLAKQVKIAYRPPSKGNISHLVIDATGIKFFGAGEWRQKCYGLERRRSWRKLHIAVDAASHEIVAAVASLSSVSDSEVLPTLLKPLRRQSAQVSVDGGYDTRDCYQVIRSKGSKPVIPPRKTATLWEQGHPRNEAVIALREGRLPEWRKVSNYHQRSIVETSFSRYKHLPDLSLRDYNAQVGEMLAGVKLLNKLTALGMPVRQPIA